MGQIDRFSTKKADGNWFHTFLSNGFVEPDGSFVEREYQAAKAAKEDDAVKILACTKPFGDGGAKRMGREVELRIDWEEVKFQVMTRLVMKKFMDHPILAESLIATKDILLIEGNDWHDNIWGDCQCGRPECAQPGKNWLGQILMCVREGLVQQKLTDSPLP